MINLRKKAFAKIITKLIEIKYNKTQYVPTGFSYLSFVKEHENILNF